MDIFPTFIELAGSSLPKDRLYDGQSITDLLLSSQSVHSGDRVQFFYCSQYLMAVRYGPYKIHYRMFDIPSDELIASNMCRGHFSLVNYMNYIHCKNSYPLGEALVYNVDRDPEERYKLQGAIISRIIDKVNLMVKDHNATLPSELHFIASPEYIASKLLPCCNPPYCICNKPIF